MKKLLLALGVTIYSLSSYGQLTAPFTQNFSGGALPTGWTNTTVPTSTSTNAFWKFSGSMGYDASAAGTSTNNFTWADGSSPAQQRVELTTDSINMSALTAAELTFLFYSYNVTNASSGYNTLFVDFYDGTTWHDSIWGYSGSSASSVWQFANVDLSTYTISGKALVRFVVDQTTASTAFYNDIALDDISVANAPPCPRPTNFSVSNVAATSADFSWNAVTGGNSYEVIYGTAGFNPANQGTSATATSSPLSVTTLSGATTYDAYLIANCGATNGLSDTVGPITFTTLCVPFTASYARNFDSDNDGQVALCWAQYNNYSTSAYARVENQGSPRSGTQQLALYNFTGFSAGDTLAAVSPEFSDMSAGNKQVRFHVKASDVTAQLIIATTSDQNPGSSITILDTIDFPTANVYQEVIFPISTANGYNGTDDHIVFAYELDGALTFDYIYIDDFFYEVVPTCPKVSNLFLAGATSTSANIGFTTTGTAVQYELGPVGFTQGTNSALIQSATGNPITITGLNAGTSYDIYVRNDCGSGDTSVWEGPLTFTTAFVPPYLEDFSNGIPSDYPRFSGRISDSTTFTPGSDWFEDGFGNVGTTGAIRVNLWTASQDEWFFTSSIDLGNGSVDYQLEFDAALTAYFNTNQGTFDSDDTARVVISLDNGITWSDTNTILTLTSNDVIANTGTHYIIPLTGYTGTVRFGFYAQSTSFGADNDYFIDNIEVLVQPTCPQPLSLSATVMGSASAQVNWNSGSAATSKAFVEYGLAGFVPSTGAGLGTFSTLDTFYTLTNLNANTTYDVYITDSCAVGGLSPASGPVSFTTDCTPFSLPYLETFDTWPISCWDQDGTFDWEEFNTGTGDNYAEADFWGTSSGNAVFVSPPIILSSYAQVEFDWSHLYSNSYPDDQLLVMVRHVGSTSMDTILDLKGPNNFNDPSAGNSGSPGNFLSEVLVLDTNSYGLNDTIEVLLWANTDFGPDLFVNDFAVNPLAPCPIPFNLTASNITPTSASINATAYFGSSYNIEWGPVGFTQGSGTGTLVTGINSLPYNLTGLSPNTFYDLYFQAVCPNGTSVWIGPITFKTPCLAALSGTYTVGGAAGPNNFATLDSALAVLNGCGVSGPVTFNMAGGFSYLGGQIGDITGASATNTITFNGNLTNPDTVGSMELLGSSHITFNDMYFKALNGFVIRIADEANDITIDGCTIESDQATTSSLNSAIAMTGASNSFFNGGKHGTNITVSNNTIIGGYAAFHSYGSFGSTVGQQSRGLVIENNTLINQYNYGVYLYYVDSVDVKDNTLLNGIRSTFGYGIYTSGVSGAHIEGNAMYGVTYGVSMFSGNSNNANARRGRIVNNMFRGSTYGIYLSTATRIDVFHNTAFGGRGFYGIGTLSNLDVRNNIFGTLGSNPAVHFSSAPATSTVNYNAYDTTSGGPVASWNGTTYQTLSAWTTAVSTQNANSVEGIISLVGPSDYHVLSALPNDVGDNSVGVLVDIDGDSRPIGSSTTVDIGADEYTPVSEDIAVLGADFDRNSPCLTNNDTIVVEIQNSIGATKNFATNNLTIGYSVSGPVNSSGSFTLNSGTLALNQSMMVSISGIDMSIPGNYSIDQVSISANAVNQTALNDTLFNASSAIVGEVFNALPDTVTIVTSSTDTLNLEVRSPFFGGNVFFTEICQFKTTSGAPTGGWPTYLTADDYIELTGVPGMDLAGITFEQYNSSGLTRSYVFPPQTLIGPNGTCILMTGQGAIASEPANYMYNATGTSTTTWSSGVASGHILRDASGNIIDAVTYGGYTFPASANVSASDWSGTSLSAGGTSGLRLEGPDVNSPTNWVASSGSPQNPNALNQNVSAPAPPVLTGFSWSVNGSAYATVVDTFYTNWPSSGIYNFVASYQSSCGLLTDTVVAIVNLGCPTPANFNANVVSCDSVELDWTGAGDSTIVTIVAAGGTPSGGTLLVNDSSYVFSGGSVNTSYDVYLTNICLGDTSVPAGPFNFSIANEGAPTASFVVSSLNGFVIDLDASASTGSNLSYDWSFGDGNSGTGVNTTHTYTTGGNVSITLIVSNACGSDTAILSVPNIGLYENALGRGLKLYPNPSKDFSRLSLEQVERGSLEISLMDMSGKQVMLIHTTTDGRSHEEVLDISGLAPGVYTLQVHNGGLTATRRLIRQ